MTRLQTMIARFLFPTALLPLVMVLSAVNSRAEAASVVLWPVDPTIAAGEKATALWVENKGKDPVTLQVRSLGWKQAQGGEDYADQDEVVASPPIVTVPAGERQLVRVIRRAPGAQSAEHSYRLLIDELPPPIKPGDDAPRAQLAVQMRYSIPLFTYDGDGAKAAPELHARIELADGKRWLVIANSGARHARLVDLRANGTSVIQGLIGYVLAGQTMRWALPSAAGGASFTVNVNGADQTLAPSA